MKNLILLLALLFPILTFSQVEEETEEVEEIETEEVMFEEYDERPVLDEAYEGQEEVVGVERDKEFPRALLDHPFIRYQHNINEPNVAEAYPWISANGLKLYFTKDHSIYFSERASRYEDFGKSKELGISEGNVTSCWLTNDELSLYTTSYSSNSPLVKKYTRSSLEDQFSLEEQLVFTDSEIGGFTSAISFTPDMKTALMYNNPSSEDRNLILFDVLTDGRLQFRERFTLPSGNVGVGQLSKDGKTIYFTDEHSEYHKVIYKVPLEDVGQAKQRVEKVLELKGVRIGKPSLTYDETYMVFNATANDVWQDNEIMVVDLNNLEFIEQDTSIFDMGEEEVALSESWTVDPYVAEVDPSEEMTQKSNPTDAVSSESEKQQKREAMANVDAGSFTLKVNKIYPNPTRNKVTVEYHVPINAEYAELVVNDMAGREIYRKKVGKWSSMYEVNLKELGINEGYYQFFVKTELGTSDSNKIYFQPQQ